MDAAPAALRRLARKIPRLVRRCATAIGLRCRQTRHARLLASMNDRALHDIGLFRGGERIRIEQSSDCWHHPRPSLSSEGDGVPPERPRISHGPGPVQDRTG